MKIIDLVNSYNYDKKSDDYNYNKKYEEKLNDFNSNIWIKKAQREDDFDLEYVSIHSVRKLFGIGINNIKQWYKDNIIIDNNLTINKELLKDISLKIIDDSLGVTMIRKNYINNILSYYEQKTKHYI